MLEVRDREKAALLRRCEGLTQKLVGLEAEVRLALGGGPLPTPLAAAFRLAASASVAPASFSSTADQQVEEGQRQHPYLGDGSGGGTDQKMQQLARAEEALDAAEARLQAEVRVRVWGKRAGGRKR